MSVPSTTVVVDRTTAPRDAAADASRTMKAVVYDEYGSPDVLELRDVDRPVAGDDEVLVRVRAASANPADAFFMRGVPYVMRPTSGLRKPKNGILGRDVAGEVEVAGKDVTRFRPGDEVFANVEEAGAFAEYARVPEGLLFAKPAGLTFAQAAAIPLAALTALQGLRGAGDVQPGQKVLIVGASGGVGTFAVQIAKALGAEVTGVCSTRNLELVRSLGADHVIDYTETDFTEGAEKYDLILQLAGTLSPSACRRALTSKGRLVQSSGQTTHQWIGPMGRIAAAAVLSPFVSQKLGTFLMKPTRADMEFLLELVEAGKLRPVVDRTYALADVPEAMRYVEAGHTQGKVVITV